MPPIVMIRRATVTAPIAIHQVAGEDRGDAYPNYGQVTNNEGIIDYRTLGQMDRAVASALSHKVAEKLLIAADDSRI